MKQWWVYMVRCADRSLYTGICTEPARRFHEHNYSPKGARYTRTRRPVRPVMVVPAGNRSTASQLEARLKRLSRANKDKLLAALREDLRSQSLSIWIEGEQPDDSLA